MKKNLGGIISIMAVLLFVAIVASTAPASAKETNAKILDLTYPYDESTIYWPTAEMWKQEKLNWGYTPGGWWYASNNYSASEHGGTHVDAPIHFYKDGKKIHEIPVDKWIGPAVKIDVSAKCAKDKDYMLSVEDIKAWEKKNGRIPDRAWVIMYTGVDTKYYPDKQKVLGTDMRGPNAIPLLSFPGFSKESAEFLVKNRNITGIGLDTPSIDAGKSIDFIVHQINCKAGKLAIENLANLDKLPEKGWIIYAMPIPIKDGTGAPARVFATPGKK